MRKLSETVCAQDRHGPMASWPWRWMPGPTRQTAWGFWIRTRLLFSGTLMVLVAAMLGLFTYATIKQEIYEIEAVFYFLLLQSMALAALVHMSLWESERERRTFELLIMRIPTPHRLIWFKLSVSLFWTIALTLPFVVGYVWFASIPLLQASVCFLFTTMAAILVALFTCIVSSFVHRGLPTAIIVVILTWMTAGILIGGELPWKDYYQIFIFPFSEALERMPRSIRLRRLLINRVVTAGVAFALYFWLHQRVSKLEKWVR